MWAFPKNLAIRRLIDAIDLTVSPTVIILHGFQALMLGIDTPSKHRYETDSLSCTGTGLLGFQCGLAARSASACSWDWAANARCATMNVLSPASTRAADIDKQNHVTWHTEKYYPEQEEHKQ